MRRLLALLCWMAMPAHAQTVEDYRTRTRQLVAQLKAPGNEDVFFSSVFTTAIPVAQWRLLTQSLRDTYGEVREIERIVPENATSAIVDVGYARAVISISLVISPNAPHAVIGLRIMGVRYRDDSADKLVADIAALSGKAAISVMRLTDAGPKPLFGATPAMTQAVGSEFKLYILAELARSVKAGERRWSDVVTLNHKSFSGRLSAWPDKAPMTLHSLATAMIAESDNSAADTLLYALGRARVEAMAGVTGHASPARMLPILSTVEAFALKQPAAEAIRARYAHADPAGKRAILRDEAARLTRGTVDVAQVADRPVAIDSVEWFAAPDDMVRLLDWLRHNGGDALSILSVNPGIGAGDAARWSYLGYKGGSEPGVMAMSFLGRTRDGRWYALSGSWNDPAATLDDDRFVALMTRALDLVVASDPMPSAPRPKP